jgi:hypothetical protein
MTKFLNLSTDTTLGGNAPSDELAVSQKAIKTYVDNHGGGGSVAIDNSTITKNADDEIQAVAVIDQNTGIAKTWTGTMAEYEAIVTKDPETEYIITDDIGGSATEIGEITEALNNKVDKGHQVVEFQEPTSSNNYTWYRKYADGWVEQGGTAASGSSSVVFSIEFADTNYYFNANLTSGGSGTTLHIISSAYTTTGCTLQEGQYATAKRALTETAKWYACGMAA